MNQKTKWHRIIEGGPGTKEVTVYVFIGASGRVDAVVILRRSGAECLGYCCRAG